VKRKLLITFLVLVLLAGGGVFAFRQARIHSIPAAAWSCLRQPQQMTLYSVHPEEPESALVGAQLFHGYRVLGQVSVSTASDQQRVADAIKQAVLHIPDPAACFNPRHALRVSDGSNNFDFVICYECGAMEFFTGGKSVGGTGIGGSPDTFNSILRAAGIPLAEHQ